MTKKKRDDEQLEIGDIPEGDVLTGELDAEFADDPDAAPKRHDVKTFVQSLPCRLTDPEYKELTVERATLDEKIADAEMRKKIVAKQVASEIEEAKGRINEINAALISGKISREIECRRVYDYDAGYVVVIRDDTGDIVSERKLTQEEKQTKLF